MDEENEVVVPAAEEPEEPENPEPEQPEEPETPEPTPEPVDDDGPAELAKARKIADDQRKRAEKAETELKKLKGPKQTGRRDDQPTSALEQQVKTATERAERAELRSMGVTHPEDITYVRDAARRLGVDVTEAATDEFVVNKLERMREARKTKDATPAPNGRGNNGRRSSKLPDFSTMNDKQFDEWESKNR